MCKDFLILNGAGYQYTSSVIEKFKMFEKTQTIPEYRVGIDS